MGARLDRVGITVPRSGRFVALVWGGGPEAFWYVDEGIVRVVANSPFMSFFPKAHPPGVPAAQEP